MTLGTLILIIIGLLWMWPTIRAIRWILYKNDMDEFLAIGIIYINIASIIFSIIYVLIKYYDVVLF